MKRAILAALLAASAARADGLHLAVGAGIGSAQADLGASFELQAGRFALLAASSVQPGPATALGLRIFPLREGAGLMVSLIAEATNGGPFAGDLPDTAWVSATIGWRWQFDAGPFVDLAAGPMMHWLRHDGEWEKHGWHFGNVAYEFVNSSPYFPDTELAVGWRF